MYKPRITGGIHIFMFKLDGGLETAQATCPCTVLCDWALKHCTSVYNLFWKSGTQNDKLNNGENKLKQFVIIHTYILLI